MANPQVEDGHTKIANELIDNFARINLSKYEWRIIWALLRKTYGWNKKTDFISLSQFQNITSISSQHVVRTLSQLLAKNMITKKNGSKVMEYGLQKDYTKWINTTVPLPIQVLPIQVVPQEALPIQVLPIQDKGTTCSGSTPTPTGTTSSGSNKRHIKDNIQKTYITPLLGEFNNIQLTNEEYNKLLEKFSETVVKEKIEELSSGIASKGYKYKNHYATILSWDRMRKDRQPQKENTQTRYKYYQAPKEENA